MGLCQWNCQNSSELRSTIKNDKGYIRIENLDEIEDSLLKVNKQSALNAQRLFNNTFQTSNRSSINPISKNLTNNIIINNIIVLHHSKSEVTESERSEEFDSRKSLASINIKRRPILDKLNTKRSSKNN